MTIDIQQFRVSGKTSLDLAKRATRIAPVYKSKKHYKKLLRQHVTHLSRLQQLLYASNQHAVLLIFQALDAAGKDGSIKHVMSGVNPQGCRVHGFRAPNSEELQHHFLWRPMRFLPEKGIITIFNRSYYEEVLVVRVHPEYLEPQKLPPLKNGEAGFSTWLLELRLQCLTELP